MDIFIGRRRAIAAAGLLALSASGCGSADSAASQPTPSCPAGGEVAGVCAGVPLAEVCGADVCTAGATCANVVAVATDAALQAALAAAKAGTCIALAPGTYGGAALPGGVSLLGRSAALVHLSSVSVSAGQDALIRGVGVTGTGITVSGAKNLHITASRSASGSGDGITVGGGASAVIESTEIVGAKRYGLFVSGAASVDVEKSFIHGSLGAGVWAECKGGCACASPSSITLGKTAIRQNSLVGVSLIGMTATLTGVDVTDNVGAGFEPSAGVSASGCSKVTATGLRVLDNSSFGILVDASSAKLGASGADASVEVSRNVLGVWIQKTAATDAVELANCTLDANAGIGLSFDGSSHGIIIHELVAKNTSMQTLPALVGGKVGGSQAMGDGLDWLGASTASIDGITLSGNARASLLIDGSVGAGSSIANVTLSGGDEQKGILEQNFPNGGTAPAVGSGAPALTQSAAEKLAIPLAPTVPAGL